MKIIFLDIDGVLNNNNTKIPYGIEKECVKELNYILQQTKADIVLISSWRYLIIDGQMKLKGFETMLRTHGVNCLNKLIGLTTTDDILFERWSQVELWYNIHKKDIESFVILDDCEEFPNYPDNFVKTDCQYGLTREDSDFAIEILNDI